MSRAPAVAPTGLGAVCGDPLETLSCVLETINDLNASQDLDASFAKVAARLKPALGYDTFAILLLDDLGQNLAFRFAEGYPPEVVAHWRFGLGQGIAGSVAQSGEPALVQDVDLDPRHIATCPLRAQLVVPLISKQRTIGVLDVGSEEPGFFDEGHLRMLRFLAGHLADAIENMRLYANMRRQAQSLSALHEASRELASILDRQLLLRRLAKIVRRRMDYDRFSVMVWNETSQCLETAMVTLRSGETGASFSLPLGQGISGTAAALRQPLRVANVQIDPRYVSCGDLEVRSELAVPLIFKERLTGLLDLESYHFNAFNQEHEQLLSTLSSSIAIALENAHLYARLEENEQRLSHDLGTAREIQKRLLPNRSPWMRSLQIAAAYAPARDLGGDLYDFLSPTPSCTMVAVGDVAGKGAAAALYGSLAMGMLRGYVTEGCIDPAEVLAYLDAELRQLAVDKRFLALGLALYSSETHRLTLANSGLPYPYLLRNGKIEEIELPGVPVGIMAGVSYRSRTLTLAPGDVVVFVSDGIEECLNDRGEPFGDSRLHTTLGRLAAAPARALADGLLAATDAHIGAQREPSDDRTVVVLQVTAG